MWPGFWPPGRAFAIAAPGNAVLLYTPGVPPDGFQPLSGVLAPSHEHGQTYLHEGDVPGLSASQGMMDLDYPVPGASAIAVAVGDSLAPTLEFLFHEAFHAFQTQAFAQGAVPEISLAGEAVSNPVQTAYWEVERRILREALATETEDGVRQLLRSYVAVRGRRSGSLPEDVAQYEARLERVEGSAEWVGRTATLHALERDPAELAELLRTDLQKPLRIPRFASGAQWVIRMRVYNTGAALATLLERLAPEWRQALQDGDDFLALAKAEAGADAWSNSTLADAALARWDHAAILQQVVQP